MAMAGKSVTAILVIFFLFPPLAAIAGASGVREAVWAGAFYPADYRELKREVAGDIAYGAARLRRRGVSARPLIIIIPHAGYRYSGRIAGVAAAAVARRGYKRVIIIAPDHRVGFSGVATMARGAYRTPLGLVSVDPEAAVLMSRGRLFHRVAASDNSEHAVEVVLPFLQSALGGFSLIPLVSSRVAPQTLADAVVPLLSPETLLVISSDFSHYLPYDRAVAHDQATIRAILNLDLDVFQGIKNSACGRTGIAAAIIVARRLGLAPELLARANSGDATADRGRVVGYVAMGFYKNEKTATERKMPELSNEQGRALLLLARRTILKKFGRDPGVEDGPEAVVLDDPVFSTRRGVFVTLNRRGRLRGCIGSLAGVESIVAGVRRNAVNAAFNDPRFKPLSAEELADLEIEVSILTEAEPLAFNDSDELIRKLRPGIDGVIIRDGIHSATFLPQVWEQIPVPADFLTHLCRKAGMAGNRWQRPGLTVLAYQVQYFAEGG